MHEVIFIKDMNDIDELKIFCEYGFHLTKDHLVTMTKNNIYLSNHYQFGLLIDDKIKEICKTIYFSHIQRQNLNWKSYQY